eukprot:TRINITY_DN14222_c0_g1_i1.p1 TRINITY_DN14222_c0_g1~~TRINITY_DN14222_c0_g1_i1.p1  ORF type:complete len:299 (+),score=70.64 TRINITY_DN14222_c0_g1_i1:131-1027(+)
MFSSWEWSSTQEEEPPTPVIRVLVVGDSTVGKTSLVELISSGTRGARSGGDRASGAEPVWTCGCTVSLARETVEMEMRTYNVEVELWEVGGARQYALARSIFYEDVDAVLFVYDVSNMKSYHNLVMWLFELCTSGVPPSQRFWDNGGGSGGLPDPDIESGRAGRSAEEHPLRRALLQTEECPALFVAHKCDLLGSEGRGPLVRPQMPDKPALLDRLLCGGGEGLHGAWRFQDAEQKLLHSCCDFVHRGRHTEASSKTFSFDNAIWRDFVRRAVQAKAEKTRRTESGSSLRSGDGWRSP